MLRVRRIAAAAAALLGANKTEADRAAMLAKADLRTLMVGEFPELQGIMGEYYAENDKEPRMLRLQSVSTISALCGGCASVDICEPCRGTCR